jgi:Ser/Thr protein kinase RdoA (MazF antagonist)
MLEASTAVDPRVRARLQATLATVSEATRQRALFLPRTIVHTDWHAGNLVFERGRISGILDFEFAHRDFRIVDLGIACIVLPPETAARMVEGYARVAPLLVEEIDLLGTVQRARMLGWAAYTLVTLPPGSPDRERELSACAELIGVVEERWPALRSRLAVHVRGG